MSDNSPEHTQIDEQKTYTREEIKVFLADIAQRVLRSDAPLTHSLVAIDRLLRLPNAAELFDEDIKRQLRDLWIKLKSTGLQLSDPPMLFGLPKDFDKLAHEAVNLIEGDDEVAANEAEDGESRPGHDSASENRGNGGEQISQ